VGYTRQSLNSVRGNTTNSNFVSDITGYESIGAGSQAGGPNVGSGRTRWTLASYLGRVNYSLLDRYLFTVTGRRDGSSRFGANNRWGFFPAAAVGWRASEESFLRDVRGLSNLKLRYSIGVAGNPSISPYQSLNRLLPQQYTFGGQLAPGYQPSAIGNPELSWETTRQSDLGLDLGLFNGRVDFTGDYYVKKTNDLLLQISLPSEVGYSTAFVNAGSVQNKGVELGLTLRVLDAAGRRNALGWTTTFNYSRNRNRVLDLGGVNRIFARDATISDLQSGTGTSSSVVQVGQPIGAFYGYQTVGLFRDSVTLNAWRAKTRLESGTPASATCSTSTSTATA
jgi:outer membrane receptor protein involved in Fe transport